MKRRTNRVNMTDVVSVWMKLSGWTVDIVCVRLCVTLNRVCQEYISQFTSVVIQRIVNIKIFSLSWVFDHTKNTILPCHPELSIRVCLDSWTRENRKFCYNRQTSCNFNSNWLANFQFYESWTLKTSGFLTLSTFI